MDHGLLRQLKVMNHWIWTRQSVDQAIRYTSLLKGWQIVANSNFVLILEGMKPARLRIAHIQQQPRWLGR